MQFGHVLSCLSNFLKKVRVGKSENLFIYFYFFLEGHKNYRVDTKKTGSVELAEQHVFISLQYDRLFIIKL